MWRLEREDGSGQPIRFLSGTEYLVGRKNCPILIDDDQSISRAHATLRVTHPPSSLGHPDKIPQLCVKDSSKYGTFVNGEKMESASSRNVNSGDRVTFGVYNSKFRVVYDPLVACSSCLNASEKAALNQALQLLGGHVVNNWTEKCTHLVMTSIKVTIKTVCALICCKSIVKPEYFNEMIKAIQKKQALPAAASFIPILDEPSLQADSPDFSDNEKRQSIFRDKFFLFLSAKQHKKLSPAVHFAGGKSKLLTGDLDDQALLETPDICVIDTGTSESQQSESQSQSFITLVMNTLHSKGLRAIPESEIGLAVIFMSTETYCNPQQHAANRNETEKATKHYIVESSLSSSMAVNETVLPAATFNTTAYVTNTEPQNQTTDWMEISGIREVKETPKSGPGSNTTKQIPALDRDAESSTAGDCRMALFPETPKPAEKKKQPQPVPSVDKPASQKARTPQKEHTSQKAGPSSRIDNYFQTIAKKRDREDDGSPLSSSKVARVEAEISDGTDIFKDIFLTKRKDKAKLSPKEVVYELNTEPDPAPESHKVPNGNIKASMTGSDSSAKRKQPDSDVVEESDLENDDEPGDPMERESPKEAPFMAKKRRVESRGDFQDDFQLEPQEEGERNGPPQQSEWTIKSDPDIKQEPQSPCEDRKNTQMLVRPKEENDDDPPARLLLSEFRSLVVSQPNRGGQRTATANHRNGPNFKKFRKIEFPGAGSFPRIIGGSDLIAHDKKKNSELEQWLRQEMEEQTRQSKEQSLAEDLFRYNPKSVKRRR